MNRGVIFFLLFTLNRGSIVHHKACINTVDNGIGVRIFVNQNFANLNKLQNAQKDCDHIVQGYRIVQKLLHRGISLARHSVKNAHDLYVNGNNGLGY